MRLVIGALLLAGCNQIFGNNAVGFIDGAPGESNIDAAFGTIQVRYVTVKAPLANATFEGIPKTTAQVGTMTNLADLQDRTVDSNGTFTVPFDILQLVPRYRIVYTPGEDGIPVEVQTSLKTADFVVPRVGRVDRTPWAQAGGSIPMNFSGAPANFPALFVSGTGLWSRGGPRVNAASSGIFAYSTLMPESGALGVPMGALGDQLVFASAPSGTSGVNGYAYTSFAGFDGMGSAAAPMTRSAWKTTGLTTTLHWDTMQAFNSAGNRAANILFTTDNVSDTAWGGVISGTQIAPFTDIPINDPNQIPFGLAQAEFDRAVFIPLSMDTGSFVHTFLNPYTGVGDEPPAFPTAEYSFGSITRQWGTTNVYARSGVQEIMLNDGTAKTTFDEGVGLAKNVAFGPSGMPGVDINNKDVVEPGSIPHAATYDLTFSTDSSVPATVPSDCVATLFEIATNSVTPLRRYKVNAVPTVSLPIVVDGKFIVSGHNYAFGISCYRGHQNAFVGDFASVSFPFAASLLYTKMFTPT